MKTTQKVKKILSHYESDNPGTKANLARMLMQGKLGGSGKLIILPVDQGFEHGPARSFSVNPDAYDPEYHIKMAVDAGLSAYAAPLGSLEAVADSYAGQMPLILKMNSSNSLAPKVAGYDQSVTASIQDALRLGCSGIGFTIYPGSKHCFELMEEIRALCEEAKKYGLFVVIWSYVRGEDIESKGETAMDTIAYGAHLATLLGAHVIKVKLPTDALYQAPAKKAFEAGNIKIDTQADRVAEVVKSCFNGKRLVVFSGGAAKSIDAVYDDARAIRDGGGNGCIMGRNAFQRPRNEAMGMLKDIVEILLGRKS